MTRGETMRMWREKRGLSQYELADFMNRDISGCPPTGDCNKASDDCKACWLDWLQQSAEGE